MGHEGRDALFCRPGTVVVGWAVGLQTSARLASGLCDWGGQRNGEAGLWHGAFFFNHKSTDQGGKSYPHVVHFLF
jgi:hypothetical protein